MENKQLEKITEHDEQLLGKISAGLIIETPKGYEIYDTVKDDTIAICPDYESAKKIAHKHNVSGLGTWEFPAEESMGKINAADYYYREFNKEIL